MNPSPVTLPSADDLYSVSGPIEPTRLSWAYRTGLVIVTIAMLILPLVYLGLIVAAGSVVWWHLTQNTWIVGGSGGVWRLLAYVAPGVAGSVLVFFLIKPLLARPARRPDAVSIEPESEPDLFDFVARICELVRAPVPGRIEADCQVNASAGFASILALVSGRFVLTIGLPLAAGLTVRQLGGILAHEFGHFAQGGGMRLTFVVRSINGWFARVVWERDRWDEALERWAKEADWRISIMLLMAQASVWCSRRILHGLLLLGHGISCFMMRQMEYDADSYEIKLVGSAAFIETSARMRELNAAAQIGYQDLRASWVRRTLPSDLPAFLLNRSARLSRELLDQIRQVPDRKTGMFDTHPADADRVRAAEQAHARGTLLSGDVPATLLFRNFDALSTTVTRHHYEHDLSISLDSMTMVDTDVAVAGSLSREKSAESARTYFGDHASLLRPMQAHVARVESLTPGELIQQLRDARLAMSGADEKHAAAYRHYEALDRKLMLAQAAQALFESGFTQVPAPDFDLVEGTAASAGEAYASAVVQLRRLEPMVGRLDDISAVRLACAVVLLARSTDSQTAAGCGLDIDPASQQALRQEADSLTAALHALAEAWPLVHEIRRLTFVAQLVAAHAARSPDPEAAGAKFDGIVDRMRILLRKVSTAVADSAVPVGEQHTEERLHTLLGLDSTVDTEIKAPNVVNAALSVGGEVIGRLCAIALQVEAAVDRTDWEIRVPPRV